MAGAEPPYIEGVHSNPLRQKNYLIYRWLKQCFMYMYSICRTCFDYFICLFLDILNPLLKILTPSLCVIGDAVEMGKDVAQSIVIKIYLFSL